MPEFKIERYEVITVQTAEKNQYGDLIVNGKIKIGNKRSNLFNIFQPGVEVKVGYAIYKDREYIATAEQTGKHIEPTKKETPEEKHEAQLEALKAKQKTTTETELHTRKSIERQTALKCATEIAAALIAKTSDVNVNKVLTWAEMFESYLENGIQIQNKTKP